MYHAPSSLIAVNTRSERSTIAPIPRATVITCRYSPASFPATVASPARRPRATARPITNKTLRPGMTSTTEATPANGARRSSGITRPSSLPTHHRGNRIAAQLPRPSACKPAGSWASEVEAGLEVLEGIQEVAAAGNDAADDGGEGVSRHAEPVGPSFKVGGLVDNRLANVEEHRPDADRRRYGRALHDPCHVSSPPSRPYSVACPLSSVGRAQPW